jgi:hypothetical protein
MNMTNHKCDVGQIDYSLADRGFIRCTACGREWTLAYKTNKDGVTKLVGWRPDPKPTGGRSVQW